jgi:2-methylcitrate dehydratase PrpD
MMVLDFIHETRWPDLPAGVQAQARRCLLDTLGAAIGGRKTTLSRIVHDHAAESYGGSTARLWLDGRQVSAPGAALANGMTIDALDIHDGYTLTKGHAGAAVVPAVIATLGLVGNAPVNGHELAASLVVGYEVALRAGLALHATASDYHTSGAWNALACAAVTARRLGLDGRRTRHALGIAEYHGPRSQMMRCIDYPTMVKDGSGWGAMAGVSAGLLARDGFTGAPAVTVEGAQESDFWDDLGRRWLITEGYFKPHAVCRWAQPAIAAVLKLRDRHSFVPEQVRRIQVTTFQEAVRLAARRPGNTEEAQYSLPFPVASALVHRRLGPAELTGSSLSDPLILSLAGGMVLREDPGFSARFPAERLARVQIDLANGTTLDSGEMEADWGADTRPGDQEILEKYRWLAGTQLSEKRAAALESAAWSCASLPDARTLEDLLASPAGRN